MKIGSSSWETAASPLHFSEVKDDYFFEVMKATIALRQAVPTEDSSGRNGTKNRLDSCTADQSKHLEVMLGYDTLGLLL